MLRVLFSVLLACLSVIDSENTKQDMNRIIDGDTVEHSNWPFLVSIHYNKHHFCGGAVIKPTAILTAAHCL